MVWMTELTLPRKTLNHGQYGYLNPTVSLILIPRGELPGPTIDISQPSNIRSPDLGTPFRNARRFFCYVKLDKPDAA